MKKQFKNQLKNIKSFSDNDINIVASVFVDLKLNENDVTKFVNTINSNLIFN